MTLSTVRRILCLGAHADDIEIGCGGTLLSLIREHRDLSVRWVVLSADGERAAEAQSSADRFLQDVTSKDVVIEGFRDGFFPYQGGEIKEYFEGLKADTAPDLIFTHFGQDLHQDHRLVSELTWNTFRDHFILEYEIPKYDGKLGSPNFFVGLNDAVAAQKLNLLEECFPSQSVKPWFGADVFGSLMRLRGVECNSPSKLAEAFYARKVCLHGNYE
ncbi:MAG: PIG-L deacetylase family protein [Pirellulales bacterium]